MVKNLVTLSLSYEEKQLKKKHPESYQIENNWLLTYKKNLNNVVLSGF